LRQKQNEVGSAAIQCYGLQMQNDANYCNAPVAVRDGISHASKGSGARLV
jgi:hypothetical protein